MCVQPDRFSAPKSSDVWPELAQNSTTGLCTSTGSATPAASRRDRTVSIDGLPYNLMAEQHARAEAFIKSRSNVFSCSEYDIGHTNIIPHCTDTGDNAPHFEQHQRHPTMQLPLIDTCLEHALTWRHWSGCVAMLFQCGDGADAGLHHVLLHWLYIKTNKLIKTDKFLGDLGHNVWAQEVLAQNRYLCGYTQRLSML